MTETKPPSPASGADTDPAPPGADETFGWTDPAAAGDPSPVARLLDSLRDAVDDLAERAGPAVRDITARAAELTAAAATKAAPLAKKAGEATADASEKLAARSKAWASDHRPTETTGVTDPGAGEGTTAHGDEESPGDERA